MLSFWWNRFWEFGAIYCPYFLLPDRKAQMRDRNSVNNA